MDLPSTASYTGDIKQISEAGYAKSLNIWSNGGYKSGNSVSSSAAPVNRRAVIVAFIATVAPADASAAVQRAGALSSTALLTNMQSAATELGLVVNLPDIISVSAPVVSSPSSPSDSGSGDSSLGIIMGVVGGILGIAIVGVIAYFVITRNKAAASEAAASTKAQEVDSVGIDLSNYDAFRGCRLAPKADQADKHGPCFPQSSYNIEKDRI